MDLTARWPFTPRLRHRILTIAAAVFVLLPAFAAAQGLTGALIGTVKDAQGGVLAGASVRLSSPSLIGGTITAITDAGGQMRFPAVPPGTYALEVAFPGFTTHHEEKIRIALGATIDVTTILNLAGVAEQVDVSGSGSRLEARDPASRPASAPKTSRRSLHAGRAFSTRSRALPASPPPRRRAGPPTRFRRSARAPMKTRSSSTARTRPARATEWRDPSPASISSRKCTPSPRALPRSSATFRERSSTSSRSRAASGSSMTRPTTVSRRRGPPNPLCLAVTTARIA